MLKDPEIRLATGGNHVIARAKPITDPAGAARVVEMFRAKYGAQNVENYYPKRNVAAEVPLTRPAARPGRSGAGQVRRRPGQAPAASGRIRG